MREVARGITFINDNVLLIERYRRDENNELLHYFTIPGGGVEEGETFEETAIRETLEETSCHVEIIRYLCDEDYPGGRCHWFFTKYLSGEPKLGGEEALRNNPDNSFKVVLVPFNDIINTPILGKGKELINQCIKVIKYNNL